MQSRNRFILYSIHLSLVSHPRTHNTKDIEVGSMKITNYVRYITDGVFVDSEITECDVAFETAVFEFEENRLRLFQ